MSRLWICVFCLFAIATSVHSDTGSEVPPSCPLKCDVLGEVNAIRQLLNQESIIRMGIDAQTQELRKTVTDVIKKLQQINSSMESTSNAQQTSLEEGISKVTNIIEELNGSVLDMDTRIVLVNSSMRKTVSDILTKLQQINSSLESSSNLQQTSLEDNISKVTMKLEQLDRSVLDADTRIRQINASLEEALTKMERDVQTLKNVQTLKQPSDQMQDVGFMVYPSSHITTTWGAKLRFNRVDRNDGQGYNVSTGMFTAPVAGMYHFYWSLLFHRGGYVTINFELNGAEKIRSYRDTDDGTHSSTSGSIYLRLKVGDQVYLEASRSGGMVQNGRYSTFGGELIRH